MKMTTTPPASWTGSLFRRPPLGVYTVTGSPEDAVRRCLDLWVTIGVREQNARHAPAVCTPRLGRHGNHGRRLKQSNGEAVPWPSRSDGRG